MFSFRLKLSIFEFYEFFFFKKITKFCVRFRLLLLFVAKKAAENAEPETFGCDICRYYIHYSKLFRSNSFSNRKRCWRCYFFEFFLWKTVENRTIQRKHWKRTTNQRNICWPLKNTSRNKLNWKRRASRMSPKMSNQRKLVEIKSVFNLHIIVHILYLFFKK